MKGWRPSACLGSTPDRALRRTHSCRTSDRSPCLYCAPRSPGSRPGDWSVDAAVPRFPPVRLAAAKSDGQGAPSVSQGRNPRSKWRQPFTCFMRPEDTETTTKRSDEQPGRTGAACAATAPLRPEAAQKEKRPWGSAQVLDKARFGEGNPRILFGFRCAGFGFCCAGL
jgi:hypothetical protein